MEALHGASFFFVTALGCALRGSASYFFDPIDGTLVLRCAYGSCRF